MHRRSNHICAFECCILVFVMGSVLLGKFRHRKKKEGKSVFVNELFFFFDYCVVCHPQSQEIDAPPFKFYSYICTFALEVFIRSQCG